MSGAAVVPAVGDAVLLGAKPVAWCVRSGRSDGWSGRRDFGRLRSFPGCRVSVLVGGANDSPCLGALAQWKPSTLRTHNPRSRDLAGTRRPRVRWVHRSQRGQNRHTTARKAPQDTPTARTQSAGRLSAGAKVQGKGRLRRLALNSWCDKDERSTTTKTGLV